MPRPLLLAALLLVACSAPAQPAPQPPTQNDPLANIAALADDVCACTDGACAASADAQLGAELRQLPTSYLRARGDRADTAALLADVDRALDCAEALGVSPRADIELVTRSFESITDAACDCADLDCAYEVDGELERVSESLRHASFPVLDNDRERLLAATQTARLCLDNVYVPLVMVGVEHLRTIRDEVCVCEDVACADDARAKIHAVGETFDERLRVRVDLEERIRDLDADITDCYEEIKAQSNEPL